jgi:release factor glutamine methyltransferase
MLLSEFIRQSIKALCSLYSEEEARSMVMYYCAEVFGFPSYIHITEPATEVPEELLCDALRDMKRLEAAEPIQYVLGYTEFCGRKFKTDTRALIPRAETELLCIKAKELASTALRILDLCTGSGCIAWTLALDIPGAIVTATDISVEALSLARSQFGSVRKPAVKPLFVQADVLDVEVTVGVLNGEKCDLLTANPPYVMLAEKAAMRPNVLDWEPPMAIFTPEQDSLVFHRAIALIARKALSPEGRGIVEINSDLVDETMDVFRAVGLCDVEIIPDFFDRPRFISFSQNASASNE